MRLINVRTLQLEEFLDESNLKYVILSHRWEDDEVTFTDMQSLDVARTKNGFYKISKCCEEALRRDYPYVWVDTCCIDKRSSSELSEAINSMFRWYRNSQICFAYLSDVGTNGPEILKQFKSSQWFERGWTLQELLAPSQVFFYNSAWLRFGSKHRLVNELVDTTGIAEGALMGTRNLFDYYIAQRVHWASRRKTTRIEDRAYSLMGLFNVNMAMLYGEGEKAFMRLQEEIIKHSDDPTIFAWSGVLHNRGGLLSPDVTNFSDPINITVAKLASSVSEQQPWTMTNKGLFIELELTPWAGGIYLAILDCQPATVESENVIFVVGIFLQQVHGRQFRRILTDAGDLLLEQSPVIDLNHRISKKISIYIRQDELSSQILRPRMPQGLPIYGIKILPIPGIDMSSSISTHGKLELETGIVQFNPGQYGPLALLDLRAFSKSIGLIHIGLNFDFRPRILMARNSACAFAYRSSIQIGSGAIRFFWDVGMSHPYAWDGDCFATNPWPARDQFEGAIDDHHAEGIFTYDVSDQHTSLLIHVMHRPRSGGPHVLVGELNIARVAMRGGKIWYIGIKLFPLEGASSQESFNLLDGWKQDDNFGEVAAADNDEGQQENRGRLSTDHPSSWNALKFPWQFSKTGKGL